MGALMIATSNHILHLYQYNCYENIITGEYDMENIRNEYKITADKEEIGYAVLKQTGIRFEIYAEVRNVDSEKPFRLAVRCGGKIIPLGVMLPQNGGFVYRKTFSRSALRELGVSGVERFVVLTDDIINHSSDIRSQKKGEEWCEISNVDDFLKEGEFRRAFSGCRNCLARRGGELVYLAVPIVKDEILPAMPIRCLGEVLKIRGNLYMVFKIRDGKLLF